MRKTLAAVMMLAWALWLGGLISLILFVTRLFGVSHALGFDAAPVLFRVFASYQLIVGMVACAAGTLLCLRTRRTSHALMSLLMILALAGALLIRGWTARMEAIRVAGQSSGPHFHTLHHQASIAYVTIATLLLVAGIGLILTLPSLPSRPETSPETAQA